MLVVDEDIAVGAACREIASHLGYISHSVECPSDARAVLRSTSVDVLMLDAKSLLPDGIALLEEVKARRPETAVVVMTPSAIVPAALQAMRAGADDLLTKRFNSDEFSKVLERASERRIADVASPELRERPRTQQSLGNIIGRSREMEKLHRILSKVAQSKHPALILGERGTGKELVARAIHTNGPSADKPFISVHCGALGPTLIESELFGNVKGAFIGTERNRDGLLVSAEDGTVFLDEIGELPLDLQAKLLRALQEKEVRPVGAASPTPIRARVLAATNRDLAKMVERGRFRKDLYYRLNVVNLRIPPLRECRADIPLLAEHFLDRLKRENAMEYRLSDEALRMMVEYSWPGNVRELEHAIQRGAIVSAEPLLQLGDLSRELVEFALQQRRTLQSVERLVQAPVGSACDVFPGNPPQFVPLALQQRLAILSTLNTLKGDKVMVAKVLGIGRTTLYRKLKEYGALTVV